MSSSRMNSSPPRLEAAMDTSSGFDIPHGDKVVTRATTAKTTVALTGGGEEESAENVMFRTPTKLMKARSLSYDSERRSGDEDDFPSMLIDSSSDDESVQELLERASAIKTSSLSKLVAAPLLSPPTYAISDDDDNNNNTMNATKSTDGSESDGRSQVSHTYVGDVNDGDDIEQIARAESLALDAQSAIYWLQQHRVDTEEIVASSDGEDDDEEVITVCLDSLQQFEIQQDEEYVKVAEQNALNIQQALNRIRQCSVVIEDPHVITGSDNDEADEDEREVGQYLSVLDALDPPSVAYKDSMQRTPPEFAQPNIFKEIRKEQTPRCVDDPTSSVTDGEDSDPADSDHPGRPTLKEQQPLTVITKPRRFWICIGIVVVLAIVAVAVGTAIGVTSGDSGGTPAAALDSNLKSVAALPATSAPTITVSSARPTLRPSLAPTRSPTKAPKLVPTAFPLARLPTWSPSQTDYPTFFPTNSWSPTTTMYPTRSPTYTLLPSSATTGLRINAGSATGYTDGQGRYWQPDYSFTGGGVYQSQLLQTVANTDDQELFQVQRQGAEFQYSVPLLPNTVYQVNLYFAEIYDGAFAVGRRLMEIDAEKVALIRNFDVFQNAGAFNATKLSLLVPLGDGFLDLVFIGKTSNASVAALEILVSGLPFPQQQLTAQPTQAP